MKPVNRIVSVVFFAFFGNVRSTPGLLDLFSFETKFGPPPRSVYYHGPPSYGHSHSHSHGPPPKTIIKYVTKSPSSPHISPYSVFSKPLGYSPYGHGTSSVVSYGSSSSGSSGWKKGRGKGKKMPSSMTMSMMMDDMTPEQMASFRDSDPDSESVVGQMDDGMVSQMVSQGSPEFGSDDPTSEVEVLSRPQRLRARPPTTMVMSQEGYQDYMRPQSQPLRTREQSTRSRPTQRAPIMVMMNDIPDDEQQGFDDSEGAAPQDDGSEGEVDAPVQIQMTRGRGKPTSSKKPKKPSSTRSQGSSSSGGSSQGWSSGPPKTITYYQHTPHSHYSDGWSGWAPSFPPSFYSSGGGSGWSGWEEGTGVAEEEEGSTPTETDTGSEQGESVDEVGTTEEGEDRQPEKPVVPRKKPSSSSSSGSKKPSSSLSGSSGSSRLTASSNSDRGRANTENTASRTQQNSAISQGASQKASGRQTNQQRPQTNQPQGDQAQNPRPVYGPPGQQGQGSNSGNSNTNGELRIGDQVISNQNGLLDEELIRTVQQIIQTFDKN